MTSLLISVLLGAILLFAIGLQKSYKDTSQKELKRQAKAGDELANLLYRAVGYGASVDILLWLIIGITAGGFFVYVSRHFPAIIAWFGSMAVIWFGFAWMPHAPVTHTGRRLTKAVTPAVQWLLDKLHPFL